MKIEETNRVEFKRELTADLDLEKEVVAFLNYKEGGIIYIGIDDNGIPVGVDDIDGTMLKIKNRIRSNVAPSPLGLFDVSAEEMEGVRVIRIFLASGSEKPYYKAKFGMSTKGCFIRIGTAAEPMDTNMIEYLFSHRVRNSLRNIRSPRQDLTFRQLHIYYDSKGFRLNDNFAKSLDLLTEDGLYNYVAYLLADENGNSIKLAKYSGTDRVDLISNNEYGYCSLLKATESLLDKLNIENTVTSKITYPYRIDKTLWDKTAMRELVINAVVHNDYSNEIPPKVEIFSDRVEITSAGRLPEGMDKEDFFGGVSNPRNKELMRVFHYVEMVEALGSGMPRILQKYGRECFVFMHNFIRIVIPFEKDLEKALESTSTLQSDGGPESGPKSRPGSVPEKIIKLIRSNPHITSREMAQELGMARSGLMKHLRKLQETGRIRRVGPNKGGYWETISNEK